MSWCERQQQPKWAVETSNGLQQQRIRGHPQSLDHLQLRKDYNEEKLIAEKERKLYGGDSVRKYWRERKITHESFEKQGYVNNTQNSHCIFIYSRPWGLTYS